MEQSAQQLIDKYVMHTYGRTPVTFVRGQDCSLWDENGKLYVDFLAGIAVCGLGHSNPRVAQAVCNQALQLVHTSNLFYNQPQGKVAKLLVENSFADRVFFCNSGAEANEAAIKLARRWGKARLNGAHKMITMLGSFHGRTMATLTATGQDKVKIGFDPLVSEFQHLPFGDLAALEKAMAAGDVVAVMLEPILGEGGVVLPPEGYLAGVRRLCDQHGAMLIFDEIQTGLGRTGKLFAHEHFGVTPDVMTLAKSLANGLPAGAMLATQEAADLFGPGAHASTFGAGPVIMAAARVVVETVSDPAFLEDVVAKGQFMHDKLQELAEKHPGVVAGVRGLGLIQGLVLKVPAGPVAARMLAEGYVVNATQEVVLRMLPPLVVSDGEISALARTLDRVLGATPQEG